MSSRPPLTEPWENQLNVLRRVRETFDMFFTGLIFAIMGRAIQTASFKSLDFSIYFELVGWCAMLLAGITSLGRIDRLVEYHRKMMLEKNCKREVLSATVFYWVRDILFIIGIIAIGFARAWNALSYLPQ